MSRIYQSILSSPKRTKLGLAIGACFVGFFTFLVFFSGFVGPYDPQLRFATAVQSPPSIQHVFGTDALGRDVLSRVLSGAKYSISVAFLAVVESLCAGATLGAASGYFGGKIDRAALMGIDALYSFPYLILALLILVMLGPGISNTAIAIAVPLLTQYYRLVRSITLELKERTFIEAERALGASSGYILLTHMLPSYVPTLVVMVSLTIARSIITVSSLDFLGLGIQPPAPEWGTDMALARIYIPNGVWWTTLFPGLAIFLVVTGFSLLAESLDVVLKTRREMEKIL
jgi:ABC-type dipeptide/oligopeptide/nickel transport system permease subunit